MQQFEGGSTHIANVVMTNPTSKAFDYTGMLYMGINQVAMAETSFHLEAGESKEVSFSVVMPATEGEYPVFLSVFSGSILVANYQATENIVITVPIAAAEPFTFSDFSIVLVSCSSATAFCTVNYACTIRNPGTKTMTHVLTPMTQEYKTDDNEWWNPKVLSRMDNLQTTFTLAPGESIRYSFEGNFYDTAGGRWRCRTLIAADTRLYVWLVDELGSESAKVSVTR